MARALSVDLRRRVVRAIKEGASCRQAAARFGVSASSAIRWHALARRAGDPAPRRQGGDRRSGRIEAHAPLILGAIERQPDITLADLRSELAGRGIAVSVAGLWRFFARRKITVKKVRACGGAGPSRRAEAARGMVRGPTRPRSRTLGVHRRDRRQHQDGAAARSGAAAGSACAPRSRMGTGRRPPSSARSGSPA